MLYVVVLVILGCISREAWSCSCAPKHPQSAFCTSPVVIRGKFIAQREDKNRKDNWEYEIKTNKIFKAPADMGDIQYLYTAKMESLCGYQHHFTNDTQTEYLITGHVVKGQVVISFCGFITQWDSLSIHQKRGFQQVYANNCKCQVIPCLSVPCETQNDLQCLWTDTLMKRKTKNSTGSQALHMTCMEVEKDMCTWQSLKSRYFTTANKSSTTN